MTTPYDVPSDPAKRHSAALTDGPDRAGARAMLKAVGFDDADLAKPLIGVCYDLDRDDAVQSQPARARAARQARASARPAGRRWSSTRLRSRTASRWEPSGMRASLVSRETIADSIELVARGHLFDGLVCLIACDKTIPAAVMALARLDIPGLVLYTGSIAPGRWRGRDVTIQDVYEAIGAHAAGNVIAEELHELESVACPAAGACGGQFTANTMATALEFLGISPGGTATTSPRSTHRRRAASEEAGRLAVDLVRRDVRPSSIITKASLENAAASVAATGGSTNGVLHLVAIAKELEIDFTIDDFDAISARTPIVADLKPFGRYVATDVHKRRRCRARRARAEEGRARRSRDPERRRPHARRDRGGRAETEGQEVSSRSRRRSSRVAASRSSAETSPRTGACVKLAGNDRLLHRGPARVFDSEEDTFAAVKAGRSGRATSS